jgi:hypothetical protein
MPHPDEAKASRSLFARWRATAPGAGAPAAPAPAAVEAPSPSRVAIDPAAALAALETALAEVLAREPMTTLSIMLAPVRAAIALPAAKRDPAVLEAVLDRIEDCLDAMLFYGEKPAEDTRGA